MTSHKPPLLATWLLEKLGFSRRNPALIGDLVEELHSGRSRTWYWRQTAIVIAKGFRRQAFSATLLSVAAVFFVVLALIDYIFWRTHLEHDTTWVVTVVMTLVTVCIFAIKRWWPAQPGKGVAMIVLLLINLSLLEWDNTGSLGVRIAQDFAFAVVAWLSLTIGALMSSRARRSRR